MERQVDLGEGRSDQGNKHVNCATLTGATGWPSCRAQDCWKRCVVRDRGMSPFPRGISASISKVRVVDGDSIEGMFGGCFVRVRLYGIDAPELRQQGGAESAETLNRLVRRNGDLNMGVMAFDRYDRVVGLIYPRSNHRRNSLNLTMVREGQAYAYTRFGGAELGIRTADQDAKAGRRGIWRPVQTEASGPGTTGTMVAENGLEYVWCVQPDEASGEVVRSS